MGRGGFRGAWGADASPLRDSTPSRPKGSPLCTILRNPYLMMDPKKLLKALLAPLCTNLEGGVSAQKNAIFGQIFPKSV